VGGIGEVSGKEGGHPRADQQPAEVDLHRLLPPLFLQNVPVLYHAVSIY
jgi:hypothetical protein